MIDTTITRICDRFVCYNLDITSILIGAGIVLILYGMIQIIKLKHANGTLFEKRKTKQIIDEQKKGYGRSYGYPKQLTEAKKK